MSSLSDGRPNGANGGGIPSIHPGYGALQARELQLAM